MTDVVPCVAQGPTCWGRATDTHHRKPKARLGSDAPANIAPVCRPCHDYIHDHDTWATERGLLIPSWEDEPTEPLELAPRSC